jgi:hypothetical protein
VIDQTLTMHEHENGRVAALLHAYLTADYRWHHDGDWHDLRIGLPAPGPELVHTGAGTFGLLSAWNPQSVLRPEPENRHADQALHDALLASGKAFVPAFSSAPDRSWREPSWLVMDLALADLDALGGRFGQLGMLAWRRGQAVRLRMLSARPERLDEPLERLAHIDWVE